MTIFFLFKEIKITYSPALSLRIRSNSISRHFLLPAFPKPGGGALVAKKKFLTLFIIEI